MNVSAEEMLDLETIVTRYLVAKRLLSRDEKVVIRLEAKRGVRNRPSILLHEPVSVLKLNARACSALAYGNINTISQLLELGARLRKLRGIGKKSFMECRGKLQEIGFTLSVEWQLPCERRSTPHCWKPDF